MSRKNDSDRKKMATGEGNRKESVKRGSRPCGYRLARGIAATILALLPCALWATPAVSTPVVSPSTVIAGRTLGQPLPYGWCPNTSIRFRRRRVSSSSSAPALKLAQYSHYLGL